MKKSLSIILITLSLLITFCSCKGKANDNNYIINVPEYKTDTSLLLPFEKAPYEILPPEEIVIYIHENKYIFLKDSTEYNKLLELNQQRIAKTKTDEIGTLKTILELQTEIGKEGKYMFYMYNDYRSVCFSLYDSSEPVHWYGYGQLYSGLPDAEEIIDYLSTII